jgi:hypothetical protein
MLTSLLDFRAIVETAVAPVLGTYQISPTQTTPSIFVVLDINKDPPMNWERTGLECLIFPPLQTTKPSFCNTALTFETWEIRLIQWDRSGSTLDAQTNIALSLPTLRVQSHTRQSIERYEQANLLVTYGGRYF